MNAKDEHLIPWNTEKILQGPQLDLPPQPFPLPAFPALIGSIQFNDPFRNNYAPPLQNNNPAIPAYQHLSAHLAQALAQLPPLQPIGHCHGCQRHQPDPPELPPALPYNPNIQMVNNLF